MRQKNISRLPSEDYLSTGYTNRPRDVPSEIHDKPAFGPEYDDSA